VPAHIPGISWMDTVKAWRRVLRRPAMSYTLRTTHTMRAMRIIVPRMPPMYIRISVMASELLLTQIRVTLSGRYRTLDAATHFEGVSGLNFS
jgi:hypothetical protein